MAFTLQSKGLGSYALLTLRQSGFVPYLKISGNSYPISRYYRKKLDVKVDDSIAIPSYYAIMRAKYPHLTDFDLQLLINRQRVYLLDKQKSLRYEKI